MALFTPEQIIGTKFEIWTEQLLKDVGLRSIQRNVMVHRSRYEFRQVDLWYASGSSGRVMFELKYLRSGKVPLHLRHPLQKSGQLFDIHNLIEEVEERRQFVYADKAFLVTNSSFDDAVHRAVRAYGSIYLKEGDSLRAMDSQRHSLSHVLSRSLEEQVESIEISRYRIKPLRGNLKYYYSQT